MSEIQWFIQVAEGKKAGPVSFEKLQQFAQKRKFFPTTKVRSTEEGAVWVTASSVPGLFDEEKEVDEKKEEPQEQALPSIFDAAAPSEGSSVVVSSEDSSAPVEAAAVETETTEQPASGSTSLAINVGDGSSAAVVKVSPFAINPKAGSSTKKGFVDPKAGSSTKKPLIEPKKKDDKPTEKKTSGGGFFGFGSKKKEDEPSQPEKTETKEKPSKKVSIGGSSEDSSARKISIGGSSDGSASRKIVIGGAAVEKPKESGFPKIMIGQPKDEPKSDDSASEPETGVEMEPLPESLETTSEQESDFAAPLSDFAVSEPDETEAAVASVPQAKKEEKTSEAVAAVHVGVPIWLHLGVVLILAAAFVGGGTLHYLAALKVEEALSSKHDAPKSTTTKSDKAGKPAAKAEKPKESAEDELEQ